MQRTTQNVHKQMISLECTAEILCRTEILCLVFAWVQGGKLRTSLCRSEWNNFVFLIDFSQLFDPALNGWDPEVVVCFFQLPRDLFGGAFRELGTEELLDKVVDVGLNFVDLIWDILRLRGCYFLGQSHVIKPIHMNPYILIMYIQYI